MPYAVCSMQCEMCSVQCVVCDQCYLHGRVGTGGTVGTSDCRTVLVGSPVSTWGAATGKVSQVQVKVIICLYGPVS